MRTLWVDYTKAIGIILVVYGHVSRGLYNAQIPMNENLFKLIDTIIYSFHMPLFFFLSGLFFVSSLRKRGLKGLIANKLDSILYLYIIWSVLQGGIALAFQQWTNNSVTLNEVLNLLWEPRVQFWFLYALFFISLVSAFIYAKIDQKYALVLFVLSTLIVAFSLPNYGIPPLIFTLPYLCFFMFGIYFNQIEPFFVANKNKLLLPLTFLFVSAHWFSLTKLDQIPNNLLPTIKLAVTLISILFTVNLCMSLEEKPSKILAFIGTSSMIIFLAHVLTGSGTRIVLQHLFGITDFYVHIAFGCFAGIFGSILLAKMLSKMGFSFLFVIPDKLSFEQRYTNSLKQIN
jgi:fucose 4-O-acetylase-like acetyltransferase